MLRIPPILVVMLTSCTLAQSSPDEFFGLDKIWDVHIVVKRADWIRLIPQRGRSATRLFGKFPYCSADVTIGSHTLKNVGFRMKGNATFLATGGTLKRSLKIDFNRYDPKHKFLGMGKINLQCNALDRTQIKESVSYEIYRSCGIAAGRTAFARVFLTMKDELENAYVGLYTIVEQVDQRFAKRTVGGGLILKPDGETLAFHGPKWNDDYMNAYHAKSPVTEELARPLIETAALFDEPSDDVFAKGIEAVMDIEGFLKYTAATAIIVNTDSPLTVPDNYYLIVPNANRKVTWIPWDMNWSLGEYGRATRTPFVDLSIMRPTEKEVFRRVLGIPRFKKRYREIVTEYIAGPCSAKAMIATIHRAHATVKNALAQEAHREKAVTQATEELGGRRSSHRMLQGRPDDDVASLETFARAREKSVKDQLAGRSEGRPAWNLFGSNDRTVRGSTVRDTFSGAGVLDATKKEFSRADIDVAITASFEILDTDDSKALDESEITEVLRRRWKATRRRRRDPSANGARRALAHLDGDADRSITASEWKSGIGVLLRFWDRDRNGRWNRQELNVESN